MVGPSGSGKSTLLRCIAGLEAPDRGSIEVAGRDVTKMDPGERDVAMVFQDLALYPHLDVRTNIAFPLMARKEPREEIRKAVDAAAEMLDISAILDRRPGELSGGERRRVSLARSVVRHPQAFLMDEPLSNLDAALKLRVQDEIRNLQRRLGTTTLYVTHDQVEAMTLGDRIAILRSGGLEQVGSPLDLYDRPANVFVAAFLGKTPINLFDAARFGPADGVATVGIRAEHLNLVREGSGKIDGIVRVVDHLGAESVVEVDVSDQRVYVRVDRGSSPSPNDSVGIDFDDRHVLRFGDDDSRIEA